MSSINTGNNTQWEAGNESVNQGGKFDKSDIAIQSLMELFQQPSMTSGGRNLKECGETLKELDELYKRAKNSTTNIQQKKILPKVEALTQGISPVLPGLGFNVTIGKVMYVMIALFSNRDLTTSTERIQTHVPGGMTQNMSIPIPPSQYIDKQLINNLTEHYRRIGEADGILSIQVINTQVVDLDLWNHEESGDPKDWPKLIAEFLAAEWEEAIMVKAAQEIVESTGSLPVTWKDPKSPYGKDNQAEARVQAIPGTRTNRGHVLTSSNLEVIATTVNNNNQGALGNSGSREICRVTATVSLNAVSWEEHARRFQQTHGNNQIQDLIRVMVGGSMEANAVYAGGYKPLRPVIAIDTVTAGEVLQNHNGLYPFFYGLYLLMVSNNNYAFAEALRRLPNASRSSLADLEIRIQQMIAAGGVQPTNNNRIILTEKNVSDVDLVNQWFRQNCSAHLTFYMNLLNAGPYSSIHNFMFRLASKNNTNEVKTVIALIDAMTDNKFTELVNENQRSDSGWTPSKPVLIPMEILNVNGITTYGGRRINTSEIDEQFIAHVKGKNVQGIESYLRTLYGSDSNIEGFKQRAQKLRVELSMGIFDTDVSINGFGQTHVWNPAFLEVMGKAFDSIGNLSIANSFGTWKVNSASFAPGIGLALTSHVGNTLGNGGNNGFGASFF